MIRDLMRNIYLTARFFQIWAAIIVFFILAYFIAPLVTIVPWALVVLLLITIGDIWLLFRDHHPITSTRQMSSPLSLGHPEEVQITLTSYLNLPLQVTILDELPEETQRRDLRHDMFLAPFEQKSWSYSFTPEKRGLYRFGQTILMIQSPLKLAHRRVVTGEQHSVAVYPSVKLVKEVATILATPLAANYGIKHVRRVGQSQEFDHVRHYVPGDDYQRINWKASSRGQALQVNHYEDERAQPIYLLIDRNRSMQLPFHGLTLLDHSINAGLVLGNMALAKYDQIGLLSFAERTDVFLKATSNASQKNQLVERLFDLQLSTGESDYQLLYANLRRYLKVRSVLFLFSNFESMPAFERVLPILRLINKRHLMVAIFFENNELESYVHNKPGQVREIYQHTMAEKILSEKRQMISRMNLHGIQTLYTKPEELTIKLINRYLEVKARNWR
ncbi:MAG: DUF58 domain-containing protein [Saprospiraceae bacterium]|nr:DUF58 domain-containing protein [Saprospiraceae bacterium]